MADRQSARRRVACGPRETLRRRPRRNYCANCSRTRSPRRSARERRGVCRWRSTRRSGSCSDTTARLENLPLPPATSCCSLPDGLLERNAVTLEAAPSPVRRSPEAPSAAHIVTGGKADVQEAASSERSDAARTNAAVSPLRVRGLDRVRAHARPTIVAKLACAIVRARAVPIAAQPRLGGIARRASLVRALVACSSDPRLLQRRREAFLSTISPAADALVIPAFVQHAGNPIRPDAASRFARPSQCAAVICLGKRLMSARIIQWTARRRPADRSRTRRCRVRPLPPRGPCSQGQPQTSVAPSGERFRRRGARRVPRRRRARAAAAAGRRAAPERAAMRRRCGAA